MTLLRFDLILITIRLQKLWISLFYECLNNSSLKTLDITSTMIHTIKNFTNVLTYKIETENTITYLYPPVDGHKLLSFVLFSLFKLKHDHPIQAMHQKHQSPNKIVMLLWLMTAYKYVSIRLLNLCKWESLHTITKPCSSLAARLLTLCLTLIIHKIIILDRFKLTI